MKHKLVLIILLLASASAVAIYPTLDRQDDEQTVLPVEQTAQRVEVVFVLDTTGSMGGLIDAAKEKIWAIASNFANAQQAPEISVGLVAYRDRGDAYVTQLTDLSSDLDSVYATLMDYQANGGGDTPEAVHAALHRAVSDISWSNSPGVYRAVFLVGDAPPKHYDDEPGMQAIVAAAQQHNLVINTIRCGNSPETETRFMALAAAGRGDYFTVDQAGGAVAITTPFDSKLAELARQLDDTRLGFGDADAKAAFAKKQAATEKLHAEASMSSKARRATFNAGAAGEHNAFGESDLVAAVESGRVKLEEVAEQSLPSELQALEPEARQAYVDDAVAQRERVRAEIAALSAQRKDYIAKEAEKLSDYDQSLDAQLFETIVEQTKAIGLSYEDAAAPEM